MVKGRFIVNPFPEMQISANDRLELQDLANTLIMTNLDKYGTFVTTGKRQVDPRRWKQIKQREQLTVYAERLLDQWKVNWYVTAKNGDRLGYHLLHSVSFPQTQPLPNRIRGNVSIIAFWRQAGPKVMEMFATGIFDPCGDMIRMLVVPGMATAFLSSVKYAHCGQMKKLAFMLDKAYTESKQRGTPNRKNLCVTCSSPISRRLGDFGKSDSSCKLCFGHVCYGCKAVRKLSFVDPDLLLAKRKVTFCSGCIKSVTNSSSTDCARARMLSNTKGVNYASIESSSTDSTYTSGVSFSS